MGRYVLVIALLVGLSDSAFARDDGRYADNSLKYWFDNLSSCNGMCCSFADGFSVSDVDWDVENGHYRVRLHGEWGCALVLPRRQAASVPRRAEVARLATREADRIWVERRSVSNGCAAEAGNGQD
jgi:hypothetical protein